MVKGSLILMSASLFFFAQAMRREHGTQVYPELLNVVRKIEPDAPTRYELTYQVVRARDNHAVGTFSLKLFDSRTVDVIITGSCEENYCYIFLLHVLRKSREWHCHSLQFNHDHLHSCEQCALNGALRMHGFRLDEKRRWIKHF